MGDTVYVLTKKAVPVHANPNSSDMFNGLQGLTSIVWGWGENFDTSSVTTMYQMFNNCSGLSSLDLSRWNTSSVTTMHNMFSGCSGLTSLDVNTFETSSVTNMSYMFSSCSGLTSLDLSKFDTSNVTTMESMFSYCSNLQRIYVKTDASRDWNSNSKITSSTWMFSDCYNLVGGVGDAETEYNSSITDKTYARIASEGIPGYFTDVEYKDAIENGTLLLMMLDEEPELDEGLEEVSGNDLSVSGNDPAGSVSDNDPKVKMETIDTVSGNDPVVVEMNDATVSGNNIVLFFKKAEPKPESVSEKNSTDTRVDVA